MIIDKKTKDFILDNEDKDISLLALSMKNKGQIDTAFVLRQIEGRQKLKSKVKVFCSNMDVIYPAKLSIEQCSSDITALHKSRNIESKLLIDLTGGFGIDSYFFSLKSDRVIYLEQNSELCDIARHNFNALGRKNIEVINGDAALYINSVKKVDIIFLDPARRGDRGEKRVLLKDCTPNVLELYDELISRADMLVLKLSPMIDITLLIKDLPHLVKVEIVAVKNECKEVLCFVQKNSINSPKIAVECFNYTTDEVAEIFLFDYENESIAHTTISENIQKYIYEPNAAIMKSGAFKSISEQLNVSKLNVNTHLYTSEEIIPNFPGRRFKVKNVWEFNKRGIKDFCRTISQANISTRNFPLTPQQIKEKLKIKDGGDNYLFATTINRDKKVLVLCDKLLL